MANASAATNRRYSDLRDSDACCKECGYCLRGQSLEARCPECGLPVAQSAARSADALAGEAAAVGAADETRLSDLRAGPLLMLAAWAALFGRVSIPYDTLWHPWSGTVSLVGGVLVLIGWSLAVAAMIVATRPARETDEPRTVRWSRHALRLVAALLVAWTFGMMLVGNMSREAVEGVINADLYQRLTTIVLLVLLTVSSILFWLYCARVATLARQKNLAICATIIATAIPLIVLMMVLSGNIRDIRHVPAGFLLGAISRMPAPGFGYGSVGSLDDNGTVNAWYQAANLSATLVTCWIPLLLLQLVLIIRSHRGRTTR